MFYVFPTTITIKIPALDRLITYLESEARNQQGQIDALTERITQSDAGLEASMKEEEIKKNAS